MSVRSAVMAALGLSAAGMLCAATTRADNAVATAPAATEADSDELGTIVVTAQRRSEDVEKVPISISAVSGEALNAAGITNVQELGNSVPGLNVENNVGNAFVFIRGIGTTALAVENDVGVYVDGVYMTSQAASLLNLSNIDHVEVLKGPQGTLFGRNAVGGALSIVTRDPSMTPSADISIGYANFGTVTTNFYGTTAVAPNLATDLAFYYSDQSQGWGHDLTTDTPNFQARTIQARNKWVYTPMDDTKVTLSVDYALIHNQLGSQWSFLPGAVGADGVSTNAGFYNSLGNGLSQNEEQQDGTMLRIDQNFGWARGVSISSIRASTNHNYIDQDATPLTIVEGGPTPQNDRSYSEELQLLSPDSSNIKWIVGVYALYDKYYTPGFNIQVGETTHEVLVVDEPTKSYAGFGQATFEVLPDTHVTAGVRYTDDHKSVSGQTSVNGVPLPPIPGTSSPSYQSTTFDKVTYRLVLDHQFTPDVMGYVSYDTGFKSGQYNLIAYADPPVKPESLDAWQAGLKSEILDHRVRVNLAGFYYKYSNIQITQVATGGTELLNAAAARIYGLDADFTAAVTSGFKVQGSAEWLHGYYSDFPNAPSYVPNVSPVTGLPLGANILTSINATGNTTVHTPKATAYLAGDYTVPFATGKLELNANLSYNSGYFWDPDNRLEQPSYTLLGAFVKWMPSQQPWDLRLWGSNLTNKEYYSYESAFSLGDVASPAAPRTYGITATYHF
jgi:iron complex outermembrane recepter protein